MTRDSATKWIAIGCVAATLSCGSWSSRIVVPAGANEPGTIGYGIEAHTYTDLFAKRTHTAVGIAAHSPERLGAEGDSLWMVVAQSAIEYCVWRDRGGPSCERPLISGVLRGPIRIIEPTNLGGAFATIRLDPASGLVGVSEESLVVEAHELPADRPVWVLSFDRKQMVRCAAPSGVAVCQKTTM